MQFKVNNQLRSVTQFCVPDFNFGQLQRWKDHEQLHYEFVMSSEEFYQIISEFFTDFRQGEIEDDDPLEIPELIHYKNVGRPELNELIKSHLELLKELIIFNSYDVLELICNEVFVYKKGDLRFSIQSLDALILGEKEVELSGVCFEIH